MYQPEAAVEWMVLGDDCQDDQHLEGEHGPGQHAGLPRQGQPGAAERAPVHLLAHLDAAAAAGTGIVSSECERAAWRAPSGALNELLGTVR